MTLAVIVGVALLAPQGSSEPTRAQMAERLARVEPGMTLSEATAICGPAYTIGEIDGATDGYIYVKYGALGPTSFPTYGFFKLAKDSRVEYVNGGLPTLIPEGLIPEGQIKELLTSIGGLNRPMTPRAAGKEFWPEYIRCANDLRRVDKEKALLLIREFKRIQRGGMPMDIDPTELLLLLLFEPNGRALTNFSPVIPYPEVNVHPHYPLLKIEGIPLFAGDIGDRWGFGPSDNLAHFEKLTIMREPITLKGNPFRSVLASVDSNRWPNPKWWVRSQSGQYFGYREFETTIFLQLLTLSEGMEHKIDGNQFWTHGQWESAMTKFADRFDEEGYAWDSKQCIFVKR